MLYFINGKEQSESTQESRSPTSSKSCPMNGPKFHRNPLWPITVIMDSLTPRIRTLIVLIPPRTHTRSINISAPPPRFPFGTLVDLMHPARITRGFHIYSFAVCISSILAIYQEFNTLAPCFHPICWQSVENFLASIVCYLDGSEHDISLHVLIRLLSVPPL